MNDGQITAYRGSIIDCPVDVIVNAANSSLLGGGGVDGVIHRAAGPGLLAECRALGGCPAGEARITGGHNLPYRQIIHAVGPHWRGGGHGEDGILASCYRSALDLAAEHQFRSIAFPAISTGAYSYPVELAAKVAVEAIRNWLAASGSAIEVRLCGIDAKTMAAYRVALQSRP